MHPWEKSKETYTDFEKWTENDIARTYSLNLTLLISQQNKINNQHSFEDSHRKRFCPTQNPKCPVYNPKLLSIQRDRDSWPILKGKDNQMLNLWKLDGIIIRQNFKPAL